jgi:hypothetical protein
MKKKIKINAKARIAHLPKELVEQGFSGEIDAYSNAFTLVLTRKGSNLKQIRESLTIVLKDIELRLSEQQE